MPVVPMPRAAQTLACPMPGQTRAPKARAAISAALAVAILALAGLSGQRVQAEPAGAYLAARAAAQASDYRVAQQYYDELIGAGLRDPATEETSLINHIVLQDFDEARRLAVSLADSAGEEGSQVASLMHLAALAHDENFAEGAELADDAMDAGSLITGLYKAWAMVGQGRMSDAVELFDEVGAQPGMAGFAAYHKAVALAQVGDYEGAEAILSGDQAEAIHRSRRGVLAHIEVLSQLERNDEAIEVLSAVFGDTLDPHLLGLRERLEAGEALPFDIARNARDGVAELYFTVATALAGEVPEAFPLMHTRLAHWLRPDHEDAVLLSASLLEQQQQYDLAIATYQEISADSPLHQAAEMGRAEALVRADRSDAAIEVLQALARDRADSPGAWTSLGDVLRRVERFEEAVEAYDRAIADIDEPKPEDWFLYYARAIAQERSGDWESAEGGFRQALELNPNQASVLNYLGYSYVEKGENLDEALGMIEQAVAARPDSGYIVDSLGWAYYRLGRYPEAVVQMERAVELEAIDPLVNDHLGDVYWAVGRKREAEFQWKRALSFSTMAEASGDLDLDRVRRKLEVGLDQVLEEEGAPALSEHGREAGE